MIQITYKKPKELITVSVLAQKESFIKELKDGARQFIFGISEMKKMSRRKLVTVIRQLLLLVKSHHLTEISVDLRDFQFPSMDITDVEIAELFAVNSEMANFEYIDFKTKDPESHSFLKVLNFYPEPKASVKQALIKGQIIGRAVNTSRVLANTPAGHMTPELLSKAAVELNKERGVDVEVYDEKWILKQKMGAIAAVSQGSENPPRFIVMKYMKGDKKEKPIVIIGKGVTFDSGGLSIKPSQSMKDMHLDMSGAAAVIATMTVLSTLKIQRNVVAIIPVVENMISGRSYRPNDIITSMSGKTIEIKSTDAEGRLILADAITYAKRFDPLLTIDVATLTGAAVVALGERASAIFTKEEALEQKVRQLGEESGDYVWPMPLWEEYENDNKGTFADIANLGKNHYGASIDAAVFLQEFAKDLQNPWIHIDIAPRMVAIEEDYLAKGSPGVPVRLLLKLIESY